MLAPIILDLEVAIEALKQKNLQLINIIGNRISTNSIILEEYDLIIIGFFMREISADCMACRFWGEKNFEESLGFGQKFIERIKPLIKKEINLEAIWREYLQFEEQIYGYIISNIERGIYIRDPEYPKKTRMALIKILKENKQYLFKKNNNLIRGIASEMSRVLNEYGSPAKELAFYILMKTFYQYYEYFVLDYFNCDNTEKEEKKLLIERIIKRIEIAFEEDNMGVFYKNITDIICEFGKQWREWYIIYGDISHVVEERRLELPIEAKKEIEDIIIEGLKDEVEKK